MQLFEMTQRPDETLFYRRDDPNDVRLGETVRSQLSEYEAANVVMLGLPQDEGVRRNKGRPGAVDAPDAIRRCLYRMVDIDDLKLFDVGNTIVQDSLEATHDVHRQNVWQLLQDGKRIVVLGGGNDTSYPDCTALADVNDGDLLAFNIDAHFDVRADTPRNSGTPYRQLLEEGHIHPKRFYEIGYQPFGNSLTYVEYLLEQGVLAYTAEDVHSEGITRMLMRLLNAHDEANAIFWGLDMDVVRAGDAPGVSAVNPIGISGSEFARVGTVAGDEPRSRVFEITELNPAYDIDERTCRLAAATVWNFLAVSVNR